MSFEKLSEKILQTPIEDLDLSTRSYNALRRRGVKSVGQLIPLSDTVLLSYGRLGKKSLVNIHQALQTFLQSRLISDGTRTKTEFQDSRVTENITVRDCPKVSPGGWLIPESVFADLSSPVAELDLSNRVLHVFARLEIETIGHVLNFQKGQLLRAGSFGKKCANEVQTKLFLYLSGKGVAHSLLPSMESGTQVFIDQLLSILSKRDRDVMQDRYGLWDGVSETLQDIGNKMGVTRERIRQIEARALHRLQRVCDRAAIRRFVRAKVMNYLANGAESKCGVLSEEEVGEALSPDCSDDLAVLALKLLRDLWAPGENFLPQCLYEVEDGVLCLEKTVGSEYLRILNLVKITLARKQGPLAKAMFLPHVTQASEGAPSQTASEMLQRTLEVSPSLAVLQDGTVVLSRWSKFRRRTAANLAEAALQAIGRPAHFTQIAESIGRLFPKLQGPGAKTIHNCLYAKQDKFVWVTSGTYGLKTWGLQRPPYIKDRLIGLLSEARYPLPYWHLREKVLEVCNCKEGSVRMTLDLNPRLFKKFDGDQYGLAEHFEG